MDTLLLQYLNELKSQVNQMAGCVEESILISTKALASRDASGIERVFELENEINRLHKKIDHDAFRLLARQSPVASDLRLIIVCTKMSVDLERMGDLACSISYSLRSYFELPPLSVANEIPQMADLVRRMVRMGFEAFMLGDDKRAEEVLSIDDLVDDYRNRLTRLLKENLNKEQISAGIEVLTIIRNLERLGDHATNIAEEVIFLITGNDIRHQSEKVFKQGEGESYE